MIVRTGGLCRLLVAILLAAAIALRVWDPDFLQAIRFAALGRIDAWLPPVPTRPSWAATAEIATVVVAALLAGWLLPRLKPAGSAIFGVAALAAIVGGAALAGVRFGLLFDPTWPVLTVIVVVASATLLVGRREEGKRAGARVAFGRSVSAAVIDAIADKPDLVAFDGTLRELTAMSLNVRDFAAIAQAMPTPELAAFLRRLHDRLGDHILARQGTLDRQSGDRVLAFWNAPLDDPHHADHAGEAALRIAAEVEALNAGWRAAAEAAGRKFSRVAIDIGIDTGDCCAGNLLSDRYQAYSAVGPSIAIAAQIEALCRQYGVGVVIGERTVACMADPRVLELDLVKLRGGAKPLRIFTLLDPLVANAAVRPGLAAAHARMIASYRVADWTGAEAALRECWAFRIEPLATLYSLYRTRIAMGREIAPPAGWEGADVAMSGERDVVTEVTPVGTGPRHIGAERHEGT